MAKEINFLENKMYVGTFSICSQEFSGKLVYETGKKFELILYNSPSIFELIEKGKIGKNIECITGIIYDEKETCYSVFLNNCFLIKTPIIGKGCLIFHFEYALFSETHEFDIENDKKFTLDLYFDTWNEFCHPQGFKSWTTIPTEYKLDITLKNKLKIPKPSIL